MRARVVKNRKVRYAVVGAGWTSQTEFIPAVQHTGNSELCVLVTGSQDKAEQRGAACGFAHTFCYEDFNEMLASDLVDAVYLTLPNFAHVDFAVRTLAAGVHLLIEKPMAVSVAQCERICAAAESSGAKLMIAYHLGSQSAMLEALRVVRGHELGSALVFTSTLALQAAAANHGAHHGFWSGPVPDIGPYPIHVARTLFGAEPVEVFAIGACTDLRRFHFEDTVVITLKFPGERMAAFTLSYNGGDVDEFRIVGTRGDLFSQPAFRAAQASNHITTVGGEKRTTGFLHADQFGGELQYFSECILADHVPEPDGEEGLLDVRVIAAIEQSLRTGELQKLPAYHRLRRPSFEQAQTVPLRSESTLVDIQEPRSD